MGLNYQNIPGISDLYRHQICNTYYAETRLSFTIPVLVEELHDEQLRNSLEDHLRVTQGQIARLEKAFDFEGRRVRAMRCQAIEGILDEIEELIEKINEPCVVDTALVCLIRMIASYQISRYDALITLARQLGSSPCATLFSESLEEELDFNRSLKIPRQAVESDPDSLSASVARPNGGSVAMPS